MRSVPVLVLMLAAAGCERRPHPWDTPDAGPSLVTERAPPPISAAVASDASAEPPEAGVPAEEPDAPAVPVRVGGPWVRCYGGYEPSGDPVKDVTRLSILCGPENGMKRLSKAPLQGSVTAGGAPVTEVFEAKRGACYRVFAVAEPSVTDLDAIVRSSRGAPIAADHGEDPWPIVQPDRPFCALEDDRYTLEVSAKRGTGRFAAEIWVLRPRDTHARPSGG